MTDNPFQSPTHTDTPSELDTRHLSQSRATYNVVTDTVTGVNVRWSDNRFQAICVLVSMVVTSLLGALIAALNPSWNLPWYGGALIGSFIGLVVGILGSGVFLMFYRAARHFKGRHD